MPNRAGKKAMPPIGRITTESGIIKTVPDGRCLNPARHRAQDVFSTTFLRN